MWTLYAAHRAQDINNQCFVAGDGDGDIKHQTSPESEHVPMLQSTRQNGNSTGLTKPHVPALAHHEPRVDRRCPLPCHLDWLWCRNGLQHLMITWSCASCCSLFTLGINGTRCPPPNEGGVFDFLDNWLSG